MVIFEMLAFGLSIAIALTPVFAAMMYSESKRAEVSALREKRLIIAELNSRHPPSEQLLFLADTTCNER